MATYTFELATEFNFPNISIYRRFRDGEQIGWRVNANEGYVFYDILANDTELDPETLGKKSVTYYYQVAFHTRNYDFSKFHYKAVLKNSVDKNYCF